MFLFYLLGVGLLCHSIFCQFWLCEEAQCVYLRRHLGSPVFLYFIFHSLHFLLNFTTILNHFCEHPDYQCFEVVCIYS